MIKEIKALSLVEVKKILEDYPQLEDNNVSKSTLNYLKKFVKIKYEKAEELRKKLIGLNIEKLKEKHISKIIDLMPEDGDDLKKIFVGEDFSLDKEEINSIMEKLKEK